MRLLHSVASHKQGVKRLGLLGFVGLVSAFLTLYPLRASALTYDDINSIINNTPDYDANDTTCSSGSSSSGSTTTDASLTGTDPVQKAYNYFITKGLSSVVASAIVGNFEAESSMNANAHQVGGGGGVGIAQWGGSRLVELQKFAGNKDVYSLAVQLDFVWHELSGTNAGDDYSFALKQTQKQANLSDATAYFMGTAAAGLSPGNVVDQVTQSYINKYGRFAGYEDPGSPRLDQRIIDANTIMNANAGNSATGETGTSAVSGTNAPSCGTTGSVDCSSVPAAATATTDSSSAGSGNLSTTRQQIVCIAQAEYQKWQSGQMKPGTNDYQTYSQGRDEDWCADFASWVYNQAGAPLTSANGGNVSYVPTIKDIGEKGGPFSYHDASGYTPVPGDLAIHIYGGDSHHVNIVVSVNTNNSSMVAIGGNEQGTTTANDTSIVAEDNYNSYTADSIVGYVSPNN